MGLYWMKFKVIKPNNIGSKLIPFYASAAYATSGQGSFFKQTLQLL